jgi:CHAD domain-containing protein
MGSRENQLCRSPGLHAHLADALKAQGRRYRRQLKRCQHEFSEEAVHDLRVELRRLLSGLELMATFVPEGRVKKSRRLLKEQLDLFDALRDTQVQMLLTRPLARRYPAARAFWKDLARQEVRHIKETRRRVRKLKPGRVLRWTGRFRTEVRARRKRGREEHDLAVARQAVQRAYSEVVRLRRWVEATDTATIHRTRIAFKKFRYMAEALAPVFPAMTGRRVAALRRYQTLMGDIQDVEVLRAGLEGFARAGSAVPGSRSLDALRRALERRRQALVARYLRAADQLHQFWPL